MTTKHVFIPLILILICSNISRSQDSSKYTLMIKLTAFDYPENTFSNYHYPSMEQAMEWSSNLYDLSFWGIHEASNSIIKNKKNSVRGKVAQISLEYILGLAWSKYGSELPIPLGIWAHEAYHCSVLGSEGLSPINGNSLFNRWDGTVYGLTDKELTDLKTNNLSQLLNSYVAGVHSENYSTQTNVLNDFYYERNFYKNALYLYNAWYVYDYFKFSVSSASDSVKRIAPEHEDMDPYYRDFAGADLTAWTYDMFSPESSYLNRDPFPGGEGVNRRIGFSDLSVDGQNFLKKQKSLSLLNFVNPAIFFVNRIRLSENFSFLLFLQYSPTLFGHRTSAFIPMKVRKLNYLLALHQYNNYYKSFFGFEYGMLDLMPFKNKNVDFDMKLNIWQQPENLSFYDNDSKLGGSFEIKCDYLLLNHYLIFVKTNYKTEGWLIGNPLVKSNFGFSTGIRFIF